LASIQSRILSYWLRRQKMFQLGEADPIELRQRIEQAGRIGLTHRKVNVKPVIAASVYSEWLIPPEAPPDRALLYIHGGAWFMGSTNTHRGLVSHIAYESRIRALSINYRLAPEHPFPAGLEDCETAYEWLQQNGIPAGNIIVAGDSAGGNLTLALLVALRDAGKLLPAGAVALSPATDLAFTGESIRTRLKVDPVFATMKPNTTIEDYIIDHDPHEPLISPLYADLQGLPPILIHVGDHEILLDDAVRFGEQARAAGVKAEVIIWPGMFHVFQVYTPILPEARQAIAQIADFITSHLNKQAVQPITEQNK
jgi:monoterpene epsilon-lactone hydrolase